MKRILLFSLYLYLVTVVPAQVKVYTYPSGKDSIGVMHDYRVSVCAVSAAEEQWLHVTTLRCDVDMHRVLSGKAHSFNSEKIAGDFGYGTRAFTLKDASYNLKSFDFNKLYLSFKALCDTDKALKSFSGNDRTVLEQLIVKLSYIAVKGEAVD